MAKSPLSNWRASPAFNQIYPDLPNCVAAVVKEFGRRQRTQFVILRHQINTTWAMMPWSQFRHIPNDHPANPCSIAFFGTFGEFRQICLSFPPDLFSGLPPADSPEADPDVPPFEKVNAELDQAATDDNAQDLVQERPVLPETPEQRDARLAGEGKPLIEDT